jgi:hypothetical protein
MKILSFNKNKILAGCLLIALSTLVSCKKLIEIPANPPTEITQAEQFADSATTMSAVAGVYTYDNQGQGFAYSDANLTIATGLSSDELSYTGSYGSAAILQLYLNPVKRRGRLLWASPYQRLYAVNDVLNGITGNNNLSAPSLNKFPRK